MDRPMYAIRKERPDDEVAIATLTTDAFAEHPHSQQQEASIIGELRRRGELTLSLVACDGAVLVGHIAFSPVTLDDGTPHWYGLGPLAVAPVQQHRGIGSALVEAGLGYLRQAGAVGCVVLGDPGFYQRLGFFPSPRLVLADVPAQYFLVRPLQEDRLPPRTTRVHYSPVFYAL